MSDPGEPAAAPMSERSEVLAEGAFRAIATSAGASTSCDGRTGARRAHCSVPDGSEGRQQAGSAAARHVVNRGRPCRERNVTVHDSATRTQTQVMRAGTEKQKAEGG